MKNDEVRILSVELTNFKNVENGIIVMPSALDKDYFSNKADLVGIYGQNGSGKTSVIEALQFIKDIFSENKIENYDHYINKRFKELKISVKFSLFIANIKAVIGYSVVYGSNGLNNSNQILSEVLTFSNFENNHLGS
ncbi:MAG: AAA family ATPase, partial [Sphaerochaetaceae bacterium]